MPPRTSRKLTDKEFADIKQTVAIRSASRAGLRADRSYAADIPREVSLQLTYKCNLRCTHCYQWNEQGFFRDWGIDKQRQELAPELIENILRETSGVPGRLYIWGGEPLMHSRFDEVSRLIERYPRTVTMCTNGLLFQRHMDDLLRIGEHLNLLVSLDGLDSDHDELRGRGTFKRTMKNMEAMLDLQRKDEYRGQVSVGCMVSHVTVHRMYEFMEWAEEVGVNTVYFQFPWYIGPQVAEAMDDVYREHFAWLEPDTGTARPTWHSYTYRLPEELLPVLRESMARLASRTWSPRIRYQPELTEDEVEPFILGTSRPAQSRTRCLAVTNRMEVHADGNVSSCKFFPEFVVGNLYETPTLQLWQSERFRRVRTILAETGMMPVCSKCILLYMNGV